MTTYQLQCLRCRRMFTSETPRRHVCSPCNGRDRPAVLEPHLTPGEVDRRLSEAVAMECAPPWVRHPQAWD